MFLSSFQVQSLFMPKNISHQSFLSCYPQHPWGWHIYLRENHKSKPDVGKYTSPVYPMGYSNPPKTHMFSPQEWELWNFMIHGGNFQVVQNHWLGPGSFTKRDARCFFFKFPRLGGLDYQWTRWWFQIFFMFTPIWGRFPFWLILSNGLKLVETTN